MENSNPSIIIDKNVSDLTMLPVREPELIKENKFFHPQILKI